MTLMFLICGLICLTIVQSVIDDHGMIYDIMSLNVPLNQAANDGVLMAYELGTVTYYHLVDGEEIIEGTISKRKVVLELKFGLSDCFKEELELWYDLTGTEDVVLKGRTVLADRCKPQMYQSMISPAKNEEDRYAGFSTYDFDTGNL